MLHRFDPPGPLPGSQQGKALPDLDLVDRRARRVVEHGIRLGVGPEVTLGVKE